MRLMSAAMAPAGRLADSASWASNYFRSENGKDTSNKLINHRRSIVQTARVLLFIFLIFSSVKSLQAQAACTTTIDGDRTSVANAVTSASDGDVICLNAGSWTYTTHVDITAGGTKAVEIRGAGSFQSPWGSAGSTIITNHSTGNGVFFGYEPNGSSNPTVSNITFIADSSTPAGQYVIGNSAGNGIHKKWLIHHNTFAFDTTPGCNAKAIFIGTNHGVIYRNEFTTTFCSGGFTNVNALDVAYGGDTTASWQSASTFGSADTNGNSNVYLETNYIEGFLITDITSSARFVGRFNEIHLGSFGGHGYDSNVTGIRQAEYYNNTFYCDDIYSGSRVPMSNWISQRGGTGFVLNNAFPSSASPCNISTANPPPYHTASFRTLQCIGIPGWPGSYPDTYPVSHQPGWGWISGSNQNVGSAANQNQPGGASGFQQALEPIYAANNTNNTGFSTFTNIQGNGGECRAMAYSGQSKSSGTTLTLPTVTTAGLAIPYANVGQELVAVFADLVGGTAPTISSSPTCSWNALTGGTNGSMRMSAWNCTVTTGGAFTVTFTHDSSSAARAGSVVVLRGLTASPLDANPAVATDNTSPYDAPSSGTLAQATEIVLGYFALNGPTVYSYNGTVAFATDTIAPGASDIFTVSNGAFQATGVGFNGTTGSTAATNVTTGFTYRTVSATTAVQPRITNSTANRDGLAGTVSFKISGTVSSLDLLDTDVIAFNREVYNDIPATGGSFDGTVGTGSGVRVSRPATCTTGVAYWSTDQGSWNSSGSGGQGVLDKCTSTNTWTNAWYVPYDYPYPGTIGGSVLSFTTQPSNTATGATMSNVVVTVLLNGSTDTSSSASITLAINGCGASVGGTTTRSASSGVATFNDLVPSGITTNCTFTATATAIASTVSSAFNVTCGATKVVFTAQPGNAATGASLGLVTVQVQNAASAQCTDSSATVTITNKGGTCTGMTLGGTASGSASSGNFSTSNLTESTTGSCTLTATSSGLSSGDSSAFTISAPATTFGFGVGRTRRK